jgi:hypothetical protein
VDLFRLADLVGQLRAPAKRRGPSV